MADWATISSLATAGGTLVLAGATYAAVRSSNRAARAAEESLLAGLRPLLVPSRLGDPPQRITFADGKRVDASGAGGVAEASEETVYLAISLRNAGSGIAVLHGWRFYAESSLRTEHGPLDEFTPQAVDLYIPAGDVGYWLGTFRDAASAEFAAAKAAVDERAWFMVELLYGDYEGGQRVVSRFALIPQEDGSRLATVARHWNIDRASPR
ncbi:MAG TPA: hypothetical protein VH306_00810 [Gaiellaceae bacterium]